MKETLTNEKINRRSCHMKISISGWNVFTLSQVSSFLQEVHDYMGQYQINILQEIIRKVEGSEQHGMGSCD